MLKLSVESDYAGELLIYHWCGFEARIDRSDRTCRNWRSWLDGGTSQSELFSGRSLTMINVLYKSSDIHHDYVQQ